MLSGLLRRWIHRPSRPVVFTNDRYLLYEHRKSQTTVRAASAVMYGITAAIGWRLLMHNLGWFSWGVHVLSCCFSLHLSRRVTNGGMIFVSQLNLLPDGKTVEIRNSSAFKPRTVLAHIEDIQPGDKLGFFMNAIPFTTKQGDEFFLSSQGQVIDKELLKAVLKGEAIDMRIKENREFIDI